MGESMMRENFIVVKFSRVNGYGGIELSVE